MARQRIINTRFWSDNYVSNLDPIEKLLFLYFITNPYTEICGVYEISLKQIALDTGIDREEMLPKLIKRFERDNKIFYIDGWVYVRNFAKHQNTSSSVDAGIKRGLNLIPQHIREKIDTLPPPSPHGVLLELKLKPKLKPTDIAAEPHSFSFENYLKAMENHKNRHVQVIGFFLKEKGLSFDTKEKAEAAIRRHLRAAKALAVFSDNEIVEASKKAQKDFPGMWTIETLTKILTK